MDPTRIDRLGTRFASRSSRRQALATSGATLAAAGLLTSRRTSAQDATPAPFPSDPHPSADAAGTDPEFLFTQTFDSGTWAPKDEAAGTYTLTLTGAAAQTTYFSDRPERVVGLAPTQQFLDGLGFTPANPPNAALVTQTAGGESDILVLELIDPVYDANAGTLTYEAREARSPSGCHCQHSLGSQQKRTETFSSQLTWKAHPPERRPPPDPYATGPGGASLARLTVAVTAPLAPTWPPRCPITRVCPAAARGSGAMIWT
jgi:hypothetical protein